MLFISKKINVTLGEMRYDELKLAKKGIKNKKFKTFLNYIKYVQQKK